MGDFAADSLRDTLFTNWALTGRLSKTASDTMKFPVQFFAHPQVINKAEVAKGVEVVKVNADENQNFIQHPYFTEVQDTYKIICRYRIVGGDEALYDLAEQDVEDMCHEVNRILSTNAYNPPTGLGTFWQTRYSWNILDDLANLEMKRELTLTLTLIKSRNTTVFHSGFGGVLVFDTSESSGDSLPASDYTYTEAYAINFDEGSETIGLMTRNSSGGQGKQAWFRGKFSGIFTAEMYVKKADVSAGTTLENLNKIYLAQANGELGDVTLLDQNVDTEGTPPTLTTSTKMQVINIKKVGRTEELLKLFLTARIIQPSTWTVA